MVELKRTSPWRWARRRVAPRRRHVRYLHAPRGRTNQASRDQSPDRGPGGDRTGSTTTDATFWASVTGLSPDGQRYSFVRVYVTAENDSAADFKLANGPNYNVIGEEPERGLALESNGARGVPTYSVVRMDFCAYDADENPNFIFQWAGPTDTVYLPPHDHRDNYNGGFSFAVYHPGTGLPQQPWAM